MNNYRNLLYHRHCPAMQLLLFHLLFIKNQTGLFSYNYRNVLRQKHCPTEHDYWILPQHITTIIGLVGMRHKPLSTVHIHAGFYYILNDCINTQCTFGFFQYCTAFLWHKTSPSTVQSISTFHSYQHGNRLEESRCTVRFVF